MWADSHCHLQYTDGATDPGAPVMPEGSLERAEAAGVARMVCVGTDAPYSSAAVAVARSRPDLVWATVGIHPHEALLDAPEVVAVGECGLDYHYDHSPREAQRDAFERQVDLAREHDLALVIHTREAWDDTFAILAAHPPPARVVFHCFTGGVPEARRALDMGAWLSFSGIVTFRTAGDIRESAALAPLDRILVETDAPYLAPVPHRGRPNEPALVPVVGAAVAEARGVKTSVVEDATWANTHEAFRRALPGLAAQAPVEQGLRPPVGPP